MRIIIANIFLLILNLSLWGQGVNFESLKFNEALAKAKKENKLVFVDCYTEWCVPCRVMAENVFSRQEAGDFFNSKFVCVKFDMEKGEGLKLKQKLEIKAYPTFFIIRPDGTVQHIIVGGGELEAFIKKVERGLDKKTSFAYLDGLYTKGKMTKEQFITYMVALQDAGERKKSEEVEKKLESVLTKKDKMKKEYWPILEKSAYDSDGFRLVLDNIATLKKAVGEEKVELYLYQNYSSALSQLVFNRPKEFVARFHQICEELKKLDIEKREELGITLGFCEAIVYEDLEKIITLISSGNVELWSHTGKRACELLLSKASKEQLGRVVLLEERYTTGVELEAKKRDLEEMFTKLKFAAHTGVYFHDLTFEQVLEVAKRKRMKIFIDCYIAGNQSCQYMMDSVFKDDEIGKLMNNNFICVRYDMGKKEGEEVRKRYDVHVCPTYVVLNWKGGVRHKFAGIGDTKFFNKKLGEVFNGHTALEILEEKYSKGVQDKEFLTLYAETLACVQDSRAPGVVAELFRVLSDEERVSERYWYIFAQKEYSPKGSDAEKFLLKNRAKFIELKGQEAVEQRLKDCQ